MKVIATRSLAELRVVPFRKCAFQWGRRIPKNTSPLIHVSGGGAGPWVADWRVPPGLSLSSSFFLLLPPLLPIDPDWTEGVRRRRRSSGLLRPPPAALRPPEDSAERAAPDQQDGGARRAPKLIPPRPWRTAARALVVEWLRLLRGEGGATGRFAGDLGFYWC
jgi:hypothetical protein